MSAEPCTLDKPHQHTYTKVAYGTPLVVQILVDDQHHVLTTERTITELLVDAGWTLAEGSP